MQRIYLIGSLRNPKVPEIALALRGLNYDVVDDWYAAGPEADDIWKTYEQVRGRGYIDALAGLHAGHVFSFDRYHLDRCDRAVLVLPAGRSGHMELGYVIGQGKPGYVLLDSAEGRWDIMYKFATSVHEDLDSLKWALKE